MKYNTHAEQLFIHIFNEEYKSNIESMVFTINVPLNVFFIDLQMV